MASTPTRHSAHPNKQYPTPSMSQTSLPRPDSPPHPPSHLPSFSPPAYSYQSTTNSSRTNMGLGLTIPEKDWTTVTLHNNDSFSAASASHPNGEPILPSPIHSKHELVSLAISRVRFVFRLLSCTFSMLIVGMMGTTYTTFFNTKGLKLMYAGSAIWPDEIDLAASNCIMAVGAVTATLSVGVLLAGLWPKIRHVTKEGDLLALVVAVINFSLSVGGAVFFWTYQAGSGVEGLKNWTCDHKLVAHPQAEFGTMCADMRYSFVLGWAIATVEGMVILNVALGFVLVRRRARETRLGTS